MCEVTAVPADTLHCCFPPFKLTTHFARGYFTLIPGTFYLVGPGIGCPLCFSPE